VAHAPASSTATSGQGHNAGAPRSQSGCRMTSCRPCRSVDSPRSCIQACRCRPQRVPPWQRWGRMARPDRRRQPRRQCDSQRQPRRRDHLQRHRRHRAPRRGRALPMPAPPQTPRAWRRATVHLGFRQHQLPQLRLQLLELREQKAQLVLGQGLLGQSWEPRAHMRHGVLDDLAAPSQHRCGRCIGGLVRPACHSHKSAVRIKSRQWA